MLTMYKVRFGPDSIESENLSEIRQNLTTNLAVTDPAQSRAKRQFITRTVIHI